MKTSFLPLVLALFFLPLCRVSAQTEQQKQTMAIINRADQRLTKGDITALDDVKALPGDDAVAALLMFFKQYYYVRGTETQKLAIADQAAQYITEAPTAGAYMKRLFKKEAGRPKSGLLARYRETTLDSLAAAKNAFAVRTLIELMDETELETPVANFSIALAKMNLPSAPYTKETRKSAAAPESIAKWKTWWEQNKTSYAEPQK